jgi:hypothetical protein
MQAKLGHFARRLALILLIVFSDFSACHNFGQFSEVCGPPQGVQNPAVKQ